MTAALARTDTFDPLRDKSYQHTRLGCSVVDFLAWKNLSGTAERTLESYEWYLARVAKLYPDRPIEEWDSSMCLHALEQFQPRSRRKARAVINGLFLWAKLWSKIDSNPVELLPRIKPHAQRIVETFSDVEEASLCSLPCPDGNLMSLLFQTGIRKGEARNLLRKHVRVDRAEVHVLQGKGAKDRVIPIGASTALRVEELCQLEGISPDQHLWYGLHKTPSWERVLRDRPIGEGTFHRWWGRCLSAAGVDYRNPHVARHTYATKYLEAGGALDILSENLGHAHVGITQKIYVHRTDASKRSDLERVLERRGL